MVITQRIYNIIEKQVWSQLCMEDKIKTKSEFKKRDAVQGFKNKF